MANAEYWRRRFESVEEAAHKKADRTIRELDELFFDTQRTVQKEIESWYARYANSNGLTLSEARKQLTAGELEEFKWDVKKYIELGQKENLSREWQKKLENASARFHVSRLESVQITIQQHLERLYGNETDEIDKHLRDIAGNGYTRTAYEIQKGIGIGWDITAVSEPKLDTLLSKPWTTDGKTFSDRLWSNQQQLVQSITKHLTQGVLRGDTHAQITEAVKKDLGTTRYQAGRLVRTETTYMNAVAAKECYKDLGVDRVEIIATLDTHTCGICQPMDRKIVPCSRFEPGVTVPPFHPSCRCTTAPVINEKYAAERIARGFAGKTYSVPANMTYEEWKDTILGSEKGITNKRNAKQAEYKINAKMINSNDYIKKFRGITGNDKADESLHRCAKAALIHRDGTACEDLYIISEKTGRVLGKNIDSTTDFGVAPNQSVVNAVKNHQGDLIGLHTHPDGTPPTGSDFEVALKRRYKIGIVACATGEVYTYGTGSKPITAKLIDDTIRKFEKRLDESGNRLYAASRDAHLAALNQLKEEYDIWYETR